MSASSSHFHQRAPRYLFRPQDHCLMRYAGMETTGLIHTTIAHDLSETGLSFYTEINGAPEEGDMLKVEFTIPKNKQIACFATVVRVDIRKVWHPELGETDQALVALQFRNLPFGHRRALQIGLAPITSDSPDSLEYLKEDYHKHGVYMIFSSIALAWVCFWMSLPVTTWLRLLKDT